MRVVLACVTTLALTLAGSPARAADTVTKATATRYADRYDGRPMKGGGIFHHSNPHIVANGPKGYPFGTWLRFRSRDGRELVAVVSDRGRFGPRHFDFSRAGAEQLGFTDYAKLEVTVIKPTVK
jgi:rare lipoprotein A (peptidoglycan hydrolase)